MRPAHYLNVHHSCYHVGRVELDCGQLTLLRLIGAPIEEALYPEQRHGEIRRNKRYRVKLVVPNQKTVGGHCFEH